MTSDRHRGFGGVVFDLDGTLADTLEDLANATNYGLSVLGLDGYEVQAYRYMVGAGRRYLCQAALGEDNQHLTDKLEELMTQHYQEHCFDTTKLYPGIEDFLKKVETSKLKMAVLSNKPQHFVDLTIEKLTPQINFEAVMGETESMPKKPDPRSAKHIADVFGFDPARVAYVGDTSIDMETANNAGMYAIGVTWGFRDREELVKHGAERIVNNTRELEDVLLK